MSQHYYIIVDSRDRTLNDKGHYYFQGEFGGVYPDANATTWRAFHYESLVTANAMAAEWTKETGESHMVLTTQRRYVVNHTVTSQDFT
jgi:protocatechuate 3,4-dioxygenase beta subunit